MRVSVGYTVNSIIAIRIHTSSLGQSTMSSAKPPHTNLSLSALLEQLEDDFKGCEPTAEFDFKWRA